MKIQVNFGDIEGSAALNEHVESSVAASLGRFESRITRVEAHLRDDKQMRKGIDDHRCTLEVRIAGDQPFVVEAKGPDIYQAVTEASEKAARAVERRIEKKDR